MKRLPLAELGLLLLLLFSCTATDALSIIERAESYEGEEKHEYYNFQIEKFGYKELYYNECYLLLEEGRLDEAIHLAKEALSFYPDYFRMESLLLYAYREAGREEEYISLLECLHSGKMRYDKEIAELLLEEYVKKGEEEKAIMLATDLLYMDTKNEMALKYLSSLHPFFSTQLEKAMEEKSEEFEINLEWNSFLYSPISPKSKHLERKSYDIFHFGY